MRGGWRHAGSSARRAASTGPSGGGACGGSATRRRWSPGGGRSPEGPWTRTGPRASSGMARVGSGRPGWDRRRRPGRCSRPGVSLRPCCPRTWPDCQPGCLVVGDAAAVFDPAAGQGVFFALRSGITAAETLRTCLARTFLEAPLLAAYDDWALRQVEYKVHGLRELYRGLGMTLARMDAEALSA